MKSVKNFKYLNTVMDRSDDKLVALYTNLLKARRLWGDSGKILGGGGVKNQIDILLNRAGFTTLCS